MYMSLKKILYKLSGGLTLLKVSIAINITNECNRTCVFCPYHSPNLKNNYHTKWFKRQPLHLSYERFAFFIQRIGWCRTLIKQVSITGKGEPFMHPDFLRFCAILEVYGIPFSITTNGDYISEGFFTILKYDSLESIRISLYGPITKRIQGVLKFDKVSLYNLSGIPIMGVEDGVLTSNYGIEHSRALKDFNTKTFCKAPFNFLTINTDGSVVPCYSYDTTSSIENSFWKIWNGKLIRKYRRKAVNGRNIELSDCNNCSYGM